MQPPFPNLLATDEQVALRRSLLETYYEACRARTQRIDVACVEWRKAIKEATGSRAERAAYVRHYRMLFDAARGEPVPVPPYNTDAWNVGTENA
jgi:hypothetical protein